MFTGDSKKNIEAEAAERNLVIADTLYEEENEDEDDDEENEDEDENDAENVVAKRFNV